MIRGTAWLPQGLFAEAQGLAFPKNEGRITPADTLRDAIRSRPKDKEYD